MTAFICNTNVRLALFIFLLASLMLLGRQSFFKSDGVFEYRVAKQFLASGALDLPQYEGKDDPRVTLGRDGLYFSVFGLGQSVLFLITSLMDRILVLTMNARHGLDIDFTRPFLFSITANAPVHALTGLALFVLLVELGLARTSALAGTFLYTFGTMALTHSTLSFDIMPATLFLLLAFLFLVRGRRRHRYGEWFFGGLFFGLAIFTRITSIIFLPVLFLYAFPDRGWTGRGETWKRLVEYLACLLPFAFFALLVLWYNDHRFGSLLATGYTEAARAYHFDTPLLRSTLALLFSPGRSIFVFSPLILFSLCGLPLLFRSRRREGMAIILLIAVNFFFFALNGNWYTARSWGPRFQLPVVLFLSIPTAFWLEHFWGRGSAAAKRTVLGLFLAVVLMQFALLSGGFNFAQDEFWQFSKSQSALAFGRFLELASERRWEDFTFWWLGPLGEYPFAPWLLAILLLGAAISGTVLLRRCVSRGGGACTHSSSAI